MSLLLETTLGDLVIDLDLEGSPELCKNVLKLAKARYYTATLVYNVQPNRFCQLGDPQGDGTGGACVYGLIDAHQGRPGGDVPGSVLSSRRRFLKSHMGRPLTTAECQEKGRVVATEMNGIADTIGSQLLITISQGPDRALDGFSNKSVGSSRNHHEQQQQHLQQLDGTQAFRSVGRVVEDGNNILDQIASAYCDAGGRPYADIRVIRALAIDDPFDDPPGMDDLLQSRGVVVQRSAATATATAQHDDKITASPDYERPPEESVETRIQADQIDVNMDEDYEKLRQQEEEALKREDKSRAIVLEMLGDLPTADVAAPENVLFVCKLNPATEDEDLELIFSRFDEKVKAEIIRDPETGSSLQYAFVEFTKKEQAAEAYFKMNNALVDDRRIKVDFSQSVAKVWDRFNQRARRPSSGKHNNSGNGNHNMPRDPFSLGTGPRGEPRSSGRGGGSVRRNHQTDDGNSRQEPKNGGNRDDRSNVANNPRRIDESDRNRSSHDARHHHPPGRDHRQHDDQHNRSRDDDIDRRYRQIPRDVDDKVDRSLPHSRTHDRGRDGQRRAERIHHSTSPRSKKDQSRYDRDPRDDRCDSSEVENRRRRRDKESRRSTSRSRSRDGRDDRKREQKQKMKRDRHDDEMKEHKHKKHRKHHSDNHRDRDRDSKRKR